MILVLRTVVLYRRVPESIYGHAICSLVFHSSTFYRAILVGDRTAAQSVAVHGDYDFTSREAEDKATFKFLFQETWKIQGFTG